jgi:hypothetical protein
VDDSAISNISSIKGGNNPVVSPYGIVYPSQPIVENYLPQRVLDVQNEIQQEIMAQGKPFTLDTLQEIQEMDPIQKIINQKSEYSDSNSNPDDSRQIRKKRMLKKHRGAKEE